MKINRYNNFCHIKPKNSNDLRASTAEALSMIKSGAHLDDEKKFISDYCKMFINDITYTEDEQIIYDFFISNIIKKKHFSGQLKKEDIRLFTQYLSLKHIHALNLNAHFEILPDYLYTLKFGIFSCCECHDMKDGSSIIYLRNKIFRNVLDRGNFINPESLYTLFESIYHEIRHAIQRQIIHNELNSGINSKEVLMWIKENIIFNYNPVYYYKNHNDMFRERDADVKGKFIAIDTIKEHFNYFDSKIIDDFDKKASDYYYNSLELIHLDPQTNYRTSGEATEIIDSYFDKIVLKYAKHLHKALYIQYNFDGTKRSSIEIENDYRLKKSLLENKASKEELELLDELYIYLIDSAKRSEVNNEKVKLLK